MILGFRRNINDIEDTLHMEEEIKKRENWTLLTYMAYFLLSIYIASHNRDQVQVAKSELDFTEQNYKGMFMYKTVLESKKLAKDEMRFSQFLATSSS
jgi:hypothetical protein